MQVLSSLLAMALIQSCYGWNPNNEYTPARVDCPSDANFLRSAGALSDQEAAWVAERKKQTDPALKQFLGRVNMTDFDAESFLGSNTSVTIGLAFSGGGYRAMLTGAGEFAALDNRTVNSTSPGHLGGLVQAATYLTGLSGGSWLVGSIVLNNFSTIDALRSSEDVWDLSHSIFNPGGINVFSTGRYYDRLVDDVDNKRSAGFNSSLTDIWGRALSQQFINLDRGGPAMSWNDIQQYESFLNHSMPFPLIVADGRAPNTTIISDNSTVFEFSPFELGSWDPSLYSFTNLTWVGSNVTNGKPNNDTCILGYDNAGFTMGTSSTLFNQFILQINSTGISGVLRKLAESILEHLSRDYDDIAIYAPNPFLDSGDNAISRSKYLTLVDGGEDKQNVPLYPLVQPQRNVDVILAFDNSADTNQSWPNGASIGATYRRQFTNQGNGTLVAAVPDQNTFLNLDLTRRPVFFGCDGRNFSALRAEANVSNSSAVPPLIIYTSNAYYTYFSNTSTFQMKYEGDEKNSIIENTYAVATYGNGTIDAEYAACVGCAIVQREVERRGLSPTAQCQRCFERYCWNGTLATTEPSRAAQEAMNGVSVLEANGVSAAAVSGSAGSSASASASASASSTQSKGEAERLERLSPLTVALLGLCAWLL